MVRKLIDDKRLVVLLYIFSLVFLLSTFYWLKDPVWEEFAYVKQAAGKTPYNWLLSTSHLTLLIGMSFLNSGLSLFSLRFLMVFIGALSTPLMYLILREVNVSKTIAVLGSLILIMNPYVNLHLKQFITEPISYPLYLVSILFFLKTLKSHNSKYLIVAVTFSILGFLNRQVDLIPAIAFFLFLIVNFKGRSFLSKTFGMGKVLPKISNKLMIASIPIVFSIIYFGYNYLATGNLLNPTTVPSTVSPDAPYAPQFGIHPLHSPFRIMQDIIFLGFMFLPFLAFIPRHIKSNLQQKFVILFALAIGILAMISDKEYIVYGNSLLVFVVASLFAYSGINLGLLVMQNRKGSPILNYAFIALIGCLLFTVLKINIFAVKQYLIFLPFLIIFLAAKIKDTRPYLLTVLVIGGYGVALSINDLQFHEKVWAEANALLQSGVEPRDIDGPSEVVSWLNDLTDNVYGRYKIITPRHPFLYDFYDVDSIKVVRVNGKT